ncbi:uncharacterized protein LOC131255722 isoform X2 [Magnolia sinica]|uniref:uncharacterized protein LOC131255722 isoform X2 n=1 Tax=Magnolia sinica TaxID=86752 RepID=UPI002657DEBC|nr:uncharacterized protein LOC131255722 isoform X2 [Magnolia sinica]
MVLGGYSGDNSLLTLWEALPFVTVISGQLHKTDKGQTEHVEFLHSPKRRFSGLGLWTAKTISPTVPSMFNKLMHEVA